MSSIYIYCCKIIKERVIERAPFDTQTGFKVEEEV